MTGQALMEAALMTPVILTMLLIIVDFGRIFAVQVGVISATREAASYVAANPSMAWRYREIFDGEGADTRGCRTDLAMDAVNVTVTARCEFRPAFIPFVIPFNTRAVWPIDTSGRVRLVE